ncbi:MAG: MBL fold metallo-hydrolase [Silvanigrellales bacterium]|nr:MBL fold metallo-hydrolase [Silvanigrellales bacterium]
MNTKIHFERFVDAETNTYTYLVADPVSKDAALFDSVKEHTDTYAERLSALGFTLRYLFETHVHADHITASGHLKTRFPEAVIAISKDAGIACSHRALQEGEILMVGSIPVQVLATPGHTSESLSFLVDGNRLLSGDTLLIDSCGRTDFQAGDARAMHASLRRLAELPNETLVYPGHDYKGQHVSTIGEQKEKNPLLNLSEEAFLAELASWNLPPPKKIKQSVPANLTCGL